MYEMNFLLVILCPIFGIVGLYAIFRWRYVKGVKVCVQRLKLTGVWVGAMGLFAQAYWSYDYITHGATALDGYQLWVLKDLALFIIIGSFFVLANERSK